MKTSTFILFFFLIISGLPLSAQTDLGGIPTDQNSPYIKGTNHYSSPVSKLIKQPLIIKSFASPVSLPTDIAWDGQFLWVQGYNEYKLYKISPVTGAVLQIIPTTVKRPYGFAYDGSRLVILDNEKKMIFFLDPANGNVSDSIDISSSSAQSYQTGLTTDGSHFWFSDTKGPQSYYTGDSIYHLEPNGMEYSGFAALGDYPSGLAYDGEFLWSSDNSTSTIRQMDPATNTIINTYLAPGGMYPNGLEWDGSNLWVINNASDSIYLINVESVTSSHGLSATEPGISVYPNPVSESATISFGLITDTDVHISVLSCEGKLITEISNGILPAGNQRLTWNPTADIKSGIYLCRVEIGNQCSIQKMVVMK
jgi:hypothetical protein